MIMYDLIMNIVHNIAVRLPLQTWHASTKRDNLSILPFQAYAAAAQSHSWHNQHLSPYKSWPPSNKSFHAYKHGITCG